MLKERIGDIEIQYNNSQLLEIEEIKRIIKKNYNLLLGILESYRIISFTPTNQEGVLYIEDFNQFFEENIYIAFTTDQVREAMDKENILEGLYLEKLIRNSSLTTINQHITEEMLDVTIAYKYFQQNGTLNDFIEFLKRKDNMPEIEAWLAKETRFLIYNHLLKGIVETLNRIEPVFLEYIDTITTQLLTASSEGRKYITEEQEFPKISNQELEELFLQFLKTINAPEAWLELYEYLKRNNRIILEPEKDHKDDSECYKDDDDNVYIRVSTDGTIKAFPRLVHEFIHSISMTKGIIAEQFLLSEFPSIFFETLAGEFLRTKGYSDEIIEKVKQDRKWNNLMIYLELFPLLGDILRVVRGNTVTREAKIELLKKRFESMLTLRNNLIALAKQSNPDQKLDFPSFWKVEDKDIELEVDSECDQLTKLLIEDDVLSIKIYNYLLGTFLSEALLSQISNNSNIIPNMIQVTNSLEKISLSEIINIFDLQDSFSNEESDTKIKTKS